MQKALKNIFAVVIGALCGAVGLSLLLLLLFWGINPQPMRNGTSYFLLTLLFTVPLGAFIGAIISFAWFSEERF